MHVSPPSAGSLVDQGIAALRSGDTSRAAELLAQALQLDPNHEQAWLWLSGIVRSDAERRFCLERVRAINPQNAAAQQGLTILPATVAPRAPSFARDGDKRTCTFPGCSELVTRSGHTLCYQHWKAVNRPPAQQPAPPLTRAAKPSPAPLAASQLVSATAIGERLAIHSYSVNPLFVELGWLSKEANGWKLAPQGKALGGVQKFHTQNGAPYVVWPETLLANSLLLKAARSLSGEGQDAGIAEPTSDQGFRGKFPAKHRTTDGHWVRSKAEQLIDNWLYMAGIAHAYERRLPIEEEAYCDFYIPTGRVYIEYWGYENDRRYQARQEIKRTLYQKYGLNLIELSDEHIQNLDDYLPQLLIKFGIMLT